MLQALDGRTLADQAFEQLEAAIVRGDLAPGSRVSEVALARSFGISRGPLREALQRLEGRKLVERTPHAGVRIVSLAPADIVEIFYAREALEGMACRLLAERASPRELDELEIVLEEHRHEDELVRDRGYYQHPGVYDFHHAIVRLCGNARLMKLCDEIYHPLRIYRYRSSRRRGRARQAYSEHRKILRALKKKDADGAEHAMRCHIAEARLIFETVVKGDAGNAGGSEPKRLGGDA